MMTRTWMQLRKGPGQQWQELMTWGADGVRVKLMTRVADGGSSFDYRSISPKLLVSAATYESCCGGEQLLRDAADDEITAVGVKGGGSETAGNSVQ
jgi:hypothetical protein